MPGRPKDKTVSRNLELAASEGQLLDSWGRKRASGYQEEELQDYHMPDGSIEKRWRLVCRDEIRCRALVRSINNPWRGNQCPKPHNKGTTVCNSHGGALPNVKKSAARRLAMASDPAAERLIHMALYKKGVADKDRIRALVEILDRAGVAGKTVIELEIKPWQKVLQAVYGTMSGETSEADIELEEGVDYEVMEETPLDDDD